MERIRGAMRVFVASQADDASRNQRRALLRLAPWLDDAPFAGHPSYRHGDLRLLTIPELHLYRDGIERDLEEHFGRRPELVVYLSRHQSESRTPSLTVHPIGNPAGADFGGRPRTLVPAAPTWMTAALRRLRGEAKAMPYTVTFEGTHHGPWLDAPTFFIEQGSTEREWADERAAEAIARTLLALEPFDAPIAIGLGGGHYVARHTDIALERRIAFGHLLPTYALEAANEGVLDEAIRATPRATLAYLHRKSLSRPEARAWEERLEARGLRVVREADLEPAATKVS